MYYFLTLNLATNFSCIALVLLGQNCAHFQALRWLRHPDTTKLEYKVVGVYHTTRRIKENAGNYIAAAQHLPRESLDLALRKAIGIRLVDFHAQILPIGLSAALYVLYI